MANFGTSVTILSAVMSCPIFSPSFPLAGPSSELQASQISSKKMLLLLVPTLKIGGRDPYFLRAAHRVLLYPGRYTARFMSPLHMPHKQHTAHRTLHTAHCTKKYHNSAQ